MATPLTSSSRLPAMFQGPYAWAGLFITLLAMATLFLGTFLQNMAPLALLIITILLVACPFLLRMEKPLFWAWLIAFPTMYYSPLRTTITGSGGSDFLIPLFILATLPGLLVSFSTRLHEHRRLLVLTAPIWFVFIGLALNVLHFKGIFRPVSWGKDVIETGIVLYLLTLAYHFIQENPRQPMRMLHVLVGFGFINSVLLVLQSIFHFGLVTAGGFLRPTGLFGFPISSSFIALITLNIALYMFFRSDNRKERRYLMAGVVTIILSCVMSLSKTSLLQVIPVMMLWSTMIPRKQLKKTLAYGAVMLVLLFLALALYNEGSILNQLMGRFSRTDTLDIRQQAWNIVLENMTLETMIFGRGWMSGTELLGIHNYNYSLFPVDLASPTGPMAIHPHNAYIKYTYELGLWGIGMLVSYVVILLRAAINIIKKEHRHRKYEHLGLVGLVFVLLFASSTTSPMAEYYTLLFLSLASLIIGYQAGWIRPSVESAHPEL